MRKDISKLKQLFNDTVHAVFDRERAGVECHLGIHNQRGWGHPESYLKRLRWESDEKKVKEQEEARKVSRKRNPDVSETDSAFRRARNPFMFASYGKTVELL